MTICPKCGHIDNPKWRGSRFDFNAQYMRYDEAQGEKELKTVCEALQDKKTFWPWKEGFYTYYRRGKGGIYLYRVPHADFKVPRERKQHTKMLGDAPKLQTVEGTDGSFIDIEKKPMKELKK